MKERFTYCILILSTILVYGNVINGVFLYDDIILIKNNPFIKSLQNIPLFFVENPTNYGGIIRSNFYRPNQHIINSILYFFFEYNTKPYHIFSIFLHLLNSILIYKILKGGLKFTPDAALLSTLLFIVHPINSEAISYVSGVSDPLALFFILLGTYIDFKKRNLLFFLPVIFILGLTSKEIAVVFPLIMLLIEIVLFKVELKTKKCLIIHFINFLILGVYLWAKFTIFNFTSFLGLSDDVNVGLIKRIINFIGTLPEYLKTLIYPIDLYIEKPMNLYDSWDKFNVILGVLLIILITVTLFKAILKSNNRIIIACSWLAITLFPYTGIIRLNANFLEHWFYIPFFGILILLSTFYDKYIIGRRIKSVLVVLLVLFGGRTIIRNIEWSSPELFYKNELRYSPNSKRMNNNLGNIYLNEDKFNLAQESYLKVLKIDPNNITALFNMSIVYIRLKKESKAEELLLKIVDKKPDMINAYVLLYLIYKDYQILKREKLISLINKIAIEGNRSIIKKDLEFLFEGNIK
ncbi:tetratricopeptide repeat protein [Tenacibaculum sp. TC6]|uniref:tetratricopeptide repeat protein n=1 Tax=Tenacibaculum sp. TC6 TaxID=3423223 RepID=UPI003D365D8E